MALKLGKRPARKGAISLLMGTVFDRSALPVPPLRIGYPKIGEPWQCFANDQYSNCVFAGAAHEHMVWSHMGRGAVLPFNDASVLADYAAVTGFNPADPDTDRGTDMEEAAQYRRKTGVVDALGVRHKIDSYLAPRVGDPDDLALLCYLTGAVGVGLMLPNVAMDQFDSEKPWTPQAKGGGHAGGHYVTCVGRNSAGMFMVVTWGRLHAMSPEFYARYSDEAVGYLSLQIIREATRMSPDGFDEATLRAHLGKLGKSKGG